jgi:hypothetical protein
MWNPLVAHNLHIYFSLWFMNEPVSDSDSVMLDVKVIHE